ncbi:hypothetical protein [Thermotoga sp.]|uniref:hypothetical protein n=1 Tax=Thermotoga sp. TaxID=28240 RepID=UPI0025D07701|nr:hypothetical protein [Thermotoga sp.]MCD6551383.1 hypothetical protein [Thermotoga sp.]
MLKEGSVVKGPFWSEPVRIEKMQKVDENYFRILGSKLESREFVDQILSKDDLDRLSILELERSFMGNPENVFLFLEASRFE